MSADTRTRAEKLAAMAGQDASPHEAEIARAKLDAMGAGDGQPPRRPPVAPAPGHDWFAGNSGWTTASSSATYVVRMALR